MTVFSWPCKFFLAFLFSDIAGAARVDRSLLAEIGSSLSSATGSSSKAEVSHNFSTGDALLVSGTHEEASVTSEATGVHLSPEELFPMLAENGKVYFSAVIALATYVTEVLRPHRQQLGAIHKAGNLPPPGLTVLKYLRTVLKVTDDQVQQFKVGAANDEITPQQFARVCASPARLDVLMTQMDLDYDDHAKQIYLLIRAFGPLPYYRSRRNNGRYTLDVDALMDLDREICFFCTNSYDPDYSLWVHRQPTAKQQRMWKDFKAIDSELGDQPASSGIIDWKKYQKATEKYALSPLTETEFKAIVKVSEGPHVNGLTFDQYMSWRS